MKKRLLKSLLVFSILLITFFSLNYNSYAASFAYKDFNWEEFSEQNKNYWVSFCNEDDPDCEDRLLVLKKRFYIRLYDLLTKVQQKYGVTIDDNIIIATVFLGYNMESFKDPVDGEENVYSLDDDSNSTTKDSYIGNDGGDRNGAKDYFERETDSLKTLINNFIGYRSTCYGVSTEEPQSVTTDNGSSLVCSSGLDVVDGKCVKELDIYSGTFFDSLGLTLNGHKNEQKCEQKGIENNYSNIKMVSSSTEEVSEEFFWKFLEDSTYLDNKDTLQDYYVSVLGRVKKKHMKDLTDDEYEQYNDEIVGVRKRHIRRIKEIIKNYQGLSEQYNTATTTSYWWPIGSDQVNDVDGVSMAVDNPSKLNISSGFGMRNGEMHNGIDIPGDLNVTNVIASRDGVIVSSTLSSGDICEDNADSTCGSGYGNYVIIQHVDGNHTLYAHLAQGSITVNVGDSVKQGQVIGKVGNSGNSTGPHLHFEVRIGGNDITSVQDPMTYVSSTNPRPTSTSGTLLEWIGNMEGTGPVSGDNYKVYADSGGVLTVGHGITLKYNKDQFLARGINPDTLSVGSLVSRALVDAIYQEDVNRRMDSIKSLMSSKGITLNENQLAALVSLQFNCGNINGFFENYNSYGSSQELCTNWWHNKALHDANGNRLSGLEKRRKAECDLFVNGNYNMNVYG